MNQQKPHIVLASASPRRKELLSGIGLSFRILPSEVDEEHMNGESPDVHVCRLALAKASEVSEKMVDFWVLGADTIVVIDNAILGKPQDEEEARSMLARLSGRTHEVFTGYAIVHAQFPQERRVRYVTSSVYIRELSKDEIADYVSTGEPMDKAGSYAIQGIGAGIVERVIGSYTNVVGLPLCEVARELKELGYLRLLESESQAMISENLRIIKEKIYRAAVRVGRDPEDIRIVAAAKGQGIEKIREAIAAGIRIIGHNYLQEAAENIDAFSAPDVQLHMIGHLQENKVNKAVDLFHVVETVDDEKLASALNRRAEAEGKNLGVMIQVSLAGEPQKSGVSEDETRRLAEFIRTLPNIRLMGLMTMPPFFDDPDRARPYFARLRELREKLKACGVLTEEMNELSMGMTGDYEAAVEEGATLVRIGTALFGPRG